MHDCFFYKNINCPVCESLFKSAKIRTEMIRVVKTDTDLLKYFEGENPYFYEINVCPDCGFSSADSFDERLGRNQLNSFASVFSDNWRKKDYSGRRDIEQALETYKLALISMQAIGAKNSSIALILLRMCWMYRLMNKTQDELRFMGGAAEYLKKVYELEDLSTNKVLSTGILIYLLGELNYRLNNYGDALKWFNVGISKCTNNSLEKKRIIKMIHDRWLEIKEQVIKNK